MWYNANVKRQWTVDSIERGPSGPDDRTCHGPDRHKDRPGRRGTTQRTQPERGAGGKPSAPNCTTPFGARYCISLRQVAHTLHLVETEPRLVG